MLQMNIKKSTSSSALSRYSLGKISRSNSMKVVLFNDHQTGANFKKLNWSDTDGVLMDVEVPIN